MNIVRIVLGVCAAVVPAACATTSASSGSNSNWLAVCSSDADCTAPLECQCGVCTKACTTTKDCSAVSAKATCDGAAITTICGGLSAPPACVLACKKDGDCAPLGAGARCVAEACQRGDSKTDSGSLSCYDRGNAVQGRYHTILDATDTVANKACTVDADCVAAPAVSCSDHCGLPFLSKTGAASIAGVLESLDREACDPYFAAGCPVPVFFCPAIGSPQCVGGLCENSAGMPSPDSGANQPTCDDLTRRMTDFLQTAQDLADKTCNTDNDCTTVTLDDGTCYHGCESVPVSQDGAAAVGHAVGSTELLSLCSNFIIAGCTPPPVPPCVPPIPPKCVSNTCAPGP